MTPSNNDDPLLSAILECLGKREQNDADRDALDRELGSLLVKKRNEFRQDREYGTWFRSAELADHIKLDKHIKQREAHTLMCLVKAFPDGNPTNIPKSSAEKLAAPMHNAYRAEVLAKLNGEKKYRGKDVDNEIADARSRVGLENKPRKSAKNHKPQTPPLEDIQALVNIVIDSKGSQPAKLGDVPGAVAWLRDISGYGDSIKLDCADKETLSTAEISNDTWSNSPAETGIPRFPLHRGIDRQASAHGKPIRPRPTA